MVLAHISGANYYSVGQKTTIGLFHHNLEIPLAVFGYVDSVITISNCQAPLITLEELAREGKPADSSVSSPGIIPYTSHNEALFGLALPLFDLICIWQTGGKIVSTRYQNCGFDRVQQRLKETFVTGNHIWLKKPQIATAETLPMQPTRSNGHRFFVYTKL